MAKKLKKCLHFLSFVLLLSAMLFCENIFNNKTSCANAESLTETVSYEVSNADNSSKQILLKNLVTSEQKLFNDFETLLDFTESENIGKITKLNFLNYSFDSSKSNANQMTLNLENDYVFSGKVISSLSNTPIVINQVVNLEFLDFEIDAKNSDYAVYFENENALTLSGNLSVSSKYFSNYVHSTSKFIYVKKDFASSKSIKITFPYNLQVSNVVQFEEMYSSSDYFEIVTTGDYYSVRTNTGSGYLSAESFVTWNFDANGGEFNSSTIGGMTYPNFETSLYKNFNFPTASDIQKDYSNFAGWFGKIEYSGKTYYFDKEMLKSNQEHLTDLEYLSNVFADDLSELDSKNAFTAFSYSTNTEDEKFEKNAHKYFFLNLKMSPTYIAKWTYKTYNLKVETNCQEIEDLSSNLEYDSDIMLPNLSRVGYEFLGYYADEYFNELFALTKMPGRNVTVYARWKVLSFEIFFESNGGTTIGGRTFDYLQRVYPPISPTKTGYNFIGWFTDSDLTEEYEFSSTDTMPAQNFTLYAKWEKQVFSVQFNLTTLGAVMQGETRVDVNYGETITAPSDPTCIGKTFAGWYLENSFKNIFDFNKPITNNTTIYARWTDNIYTISFVTNNGETLNAIEFTYNEIITLPTGLTLKNHIFAGWFADGNFETEFSQNRMGTDDIVVYAKWTEKQQVSINTNTQTYEFENSRARFEAMSSYSGFTIMYLVDGDWRSIVPTAIGKYDVKITRDEDATYASFETVIKEGLIIAPKELNLYWLIIIFYVLTVIEIVVAIYVRHLKQMKVSRTLSVVFGTSCIPTGQFVQIIISGLFFVAGFVYLIYELVEINKTANNEVFEPSKLDNRERFKDDLVFQNNVQIDPDFEYEVKTKESFGDKYSEKDIERMLVNDTYEDKLHKKDNSQNDIDDFDENDLFGEHKKSYIKGLKPRNSNNSNLETQNNEDQNSNDDGKIFSTFDDKNIISANDEVFSSDENEEDSENIVSSLTVSNLDDYKFDKTEIETESKNEKPSENIEINSEKYKNMSDEELNALIRGENTSDFDNKDVR